MNIDSENNIFTHKNETYPLFEDTSISEDVLLHLCDVAEQTVSELVTKINECANETVA